MRDVDCRSLLRLRENFATRLKPRVQATVAASCLSIYFGVTSLTRLPGIFLLEKEGGLRMCHIPSSKDYVAEKTTGNDWKTLPSNRYPLLSKTIL